MLRGNHSAAVAIGPLGGGKDAFSETRSAREYFANAGNFDNVYADGNNHR